MNPTILGVIGPGFLNQVPTFLESLGSESEALLHRIRRDRTCRKCRNSTAIGTDVPRRHRSSCVDHILAFLRV